MSARPLGRVRPIGQPSTRTRSLPAAAAYRAELSRSNVRRAFSYTSSELLYVGPILAAGVFTPWKSSRENRVLKGLRVYAAGGAAEVGTVPPSIRSNDEIGRVLGPGELDTVMIRLVDAEGVPYVMDIPARRCSHFPLPAATTDLVPFVVRPMLTALDSGGVVITDPGLIGLGINWYLAVELFYDEAPR